MSSKANKEVNARPSFESLMDDGSGISFELPSLAYNIRQEMFGVLDSFLSFMRTYDGKKTHNMLALTFDPRFKSLCFVCSYVGKEQGVSIVRSMIGKPCIPCWSNCITTYIQL